MRFEWHAGKAAKNAVKHGVTFEEAIGVFDDPNAVYLEDSTHSTDEVREKVIGSTDRAGIVLVIFTERHDDVLRIIGARKARKEEKDIYAKKATIP